MPGCGLAAPNMLSFFFSKSVVDAVAIHPHCYHVASFTLIHLVVKLASRERREQREQSGQCREQKQKVEKVCRMLAL